MKVYLITGNKEKLLTAQMFFKGSGIEISQKKLDCPEIQHKDVKEIAKFSAKWAAEKLNAAVIKNDCGFEIEALNGFPGAFVAYIERWIGIEGFLKLMKDQENRNARFVDATAFCEPGKEPVVFTAETKGRLATEQKGEHGWGLDRLFIIDGNEGVVGMHPIENRVKLYNNVHWKELKSYLKKSLGK